MIKTLVILLGVGGMMAFFEGVMGIVFPRIARKRIIIVGIVMMIVCIFIDRFGGVGVF